MHRGIPAWLNREKAVFALAAAWLVVTGAGALMSPDINEWGPARTDDRLARASELTLDATPPQAPGGRDPFFWSPRVVETSKVENKGSGPVGPIVPDDHGRGAGGHNEHAVGPSEPGVTIDEVPPEPLVLRVRCVGTVKVDDGARWAVFEDETTSGYFAVPAGDRPRR